MKILLEEALSPSVLEIHDESARHSHHAHARSLQQDARGPQQVGETHYRLSIVSKLFDGMRPLARHRLVHDILATEFKAGLHALSLSLKGEDKS